MMTKTLYVTAFLANLAQIVFALFLFSEGYGRDALLALLLLIPPTVSILALYAGPDPEERKLGKALRKARLRAELDALGKNR